MQPRFFVDRILDMQQIAHSTVNSHAMRVYTHKNSHTFRLTWISSCVIIDLVQKHLKELL
jgi:hypothetical protein